MTEQSAPRVPRTAAIAGHILVVDDNETNRDLLSRRLERQGHTTVQAEDGGAAIKLLEAQRDSIDLVLLDVMMPVMDGYEVLATMKSREDLRDVPVIMISALTEMDSVVKCIEQGAVDYLPKPFNAVLLRARVDACLEKKQLRDKERQAFAALRESQARLAAELAEASAYVQALLPAPISGEISTDWQSVPSEELGGDLFGYRFLDDDRFACYLFDVSGHGVGAALLSVSVANSLRSESMSDVDFGDPSAVLSALNEMFEMEKNNNMYFTAWYGVYARSKREIVYASGGHPPALLVSYTPDGPKVERLKTPGMIIGGMPGVPFPSARCAVAPGSRLFLFSDGVYEVTKPDGGEMTLDEFEKLAVEPPAAGVGHTAAILARVRALRGAASFEDDFSILCVSLV